MTSVLLADDHALVRSGFAMVLSVEDDLEVVGQAADGRQAVERVAEGGVDVVLMDVQMPDMDGLEATRRIVAAGGAKVIILTTFDREDYLFEALRAGASGFLLKNADPDDLVDAVRSVADGHALLAPEATVRVIQRWVAADAAAPGASGPHGAAAPTSAAAAQRTTGTTATDPSAGPTAEVGASGPGRPSEEHRRLLEGLTGRESEILRLMAEGLSNAEIAQRLFVGSATVKTHVSNVLAKTGSRDRVQAVVLAHRAGVVGS